MFAFIRGTMDVRFTTPANVYVCGQSQSDKSYLVRSMLCYLNELFYPVPNKIIYCYGVRQREFGEMESKISNICFVEGFPENLFDILERCQNSLVVVDDLMSECFNDQRMSDLFTRGSHHCGISVMYLTQNLFLPGKQSRTISLNSHYMIIFKNRRDILGFSTLARQIYPKKTNYILESFQDDTNRPFGYLMLDMHQYGKPNLPKVYRDLYVVLELLQVYSRFVKWYSKLP